MVKLSNLPFGQRSKDNLQEHGTWYTEQGTRNREHRTTAIRKYTEYNCCNYVSLVVMAQDGRTEFFNLSQDGMVPNSTNWKFSHGKSWEMGKYISQAH